MLFDKYNVIDKSVPLIIKISMFILIISLLGLMFISIISILGLLLYPHLCSEILDYTSLESITKQYKIYLNLAFKTSLYTLVFSILSVILSVILSIIYSFANKRNCEQKIKDILLNLNHEEIRLLEYLYNNEDDKLLLESNKFIIKRLQYYKIIHRINDENIYDSPKFDNIKPIYAMDYWVYIYYKEEVREKVRKDNTNKRNTRRKKHISKKNKSKGEE